MNIKVNHKIIKEMCGTVSFKRGDSFFRANKVTFEQYESDICVATVNGTEDFHVTIKKDMVGRIQTTCSCSALLDFSKCCQHVAAVLIAVYERQRLDDFPSEQSKQSNDRELSEDFMALFQDRPTRTSRHQLHFEKDRYWMFTLRLNRFQLGKGSTYLE